jgi:hypothetical protein
MPRPMFATLLLIPLLFVQTGDLAARSASKRVWLRVHAGPRLTEAQQVRTMLAPEGLKGGRLQQAFIRRSRGPGGTTLFQVLTGPFGSAMDAVVHGLALRKDTRFVRAGLRLRSLAVLLPTSFLPLPLRIDAKSLERLNPGRKKPYPALADLLLSRAIGFSLPDHALPAIERATARFTPWRPLLVLGERTACNAKRTTCLRWFEVLHPVLIRTAWLPAYQLVLHRQLRPMKLTEGAGVTKARGAFWKVGRSPGGQVFRAAFRRGRLPPQLHTLVLADRLKPPYRLVIDKHGPGIYNAEKNVVQRIKISRWTYKRPPLWKLPASLRRRRPHKRVRRPAPPAGMPRSMSAAKRKSKRR